MSRIASRWVRLVLAPAVLLGCGDQEGEAQSAGPDSASPAQDPVVDLSQLGFDEGTMATAVIGVAEFSDFGCVYCAQFHTESYPTLHEEFVVPGEVLWKYVPISVAGFPNADMAGWTGICAGEMGAFARMRDHLFENREAWMAGDPDEARQLFESYAAELELDAGAFAECLDDPATSDRLERNNQVSRQAGVEGTPSFVIQGGLVSGAPPLADFRAALRRIIDQTRAATAPGADTANPGASP